MIDVRRIFINSVRVYFLPLVAAARAVLNEIKSSDQHRQHSA